MLSYTKKLKKERMLLFVLCMMLAISMLSCNMPSSVSYTNYFLNTIRDKENTRRVIRDYSESLNINQMVLCPAFPPKLFGRVNVDMEALKYFNDEGIVNRNPQVVNGGRFRPINCRYPPHNDVIHFSTLTFRPRHKVAIIIPYRDRQHHLNLFMNHMHPILQRQQLDYGIYVIEQESPKRFNKAQLMNIGFLEASRIYDYDCFIFHDVDLMPENDRIMYTCNKKELKHLSVAINKWNYKVKFPYLFGGVTAFKKSDYILVNGFSNRFWGWGGEDDNMYLRTLKSGLKIFKLPVKMSHYKMVQHSRDHGNPVNPARFYLVNDAVNNYSDEGLNSVMYTLHNVSKRRLYTLINVSLNDDQHYMLRVKD